MRLARRLAHWLRLSEVDVDLVDELAFHREMIERDLVARGMSPVDARDAARRTMGNETIMREESRGVWIWPSLEAAWQDARHAALGLRRTPTFTAGVALTLALGIGANTAMFSLVDRLLLRPPAHMIDPAMVHRVYLYKTVEGRERSTGGQYARYADIARWSTTFSSSAAFGLRKLGVGIGQDTRLENVALVSAGFFGFFDAPAALGRYFTPREDSPPEPARVVVLSHGAWQRRFGGRADVLGTRIQIDALQYTVIGVAPDDFVGLWPFNPPMAFIPVTTYASAHAGADWPTNYGHAIGIGMIVRRKSGVTIAAAAADLGAALGRSFQAEHDADPRSGLPTQLRPRAVAAPVLADRGPEPSSISRSATWLSGVTLIVLLIACANVLNLIVARAIARRRETAVRVALGVSRRRLFGQLFTEGLVLAIIGGVLGMLVAIWGSGVLTTAFLPGRVRPSLITDWRTLSVAGSMVLAVAVLAGLAPLMQIRRADLTGDLKATARDGGHPRSRLRTGLLLLQSGLSVVLLVGACLFVQSLRNVRHVRLGFDADSVVEVDLNLRGVKLDSAAAVALRLRLLDAAKGVPGVVHATLQESTPFDGETSWPLFVSGIDSVRTLGEFDFNTVSADYFATMGTRIVRGRGIASTDVEHGRLVAVVGQLMANALWPAKDPIGQCVRVAADTLPCRYVVGVAEDIHSQSIDPEPARFFYYLPAAQWHPQEGGLFVRGRDATRLLEPLRSRLQREMPGTAFITVRRLGDIVGAALRPWIVGATVFSAFGALALVLAAIGLYSVVAYDVTQRKHDLGVRLALGASRSSLVGLVVAQGVRVSLAGVAIGCAIAAGAGRWLGPMLFEQRASDPRVFAVVIGVVLVVATVASAVPAWQAARLDPKSVLQAD